MFYTQVREFWRILQPPIEAAAERVQAPLELYDYGELGLDEMSIASFQRRDPYSNPVGFAQAIEMLAREGWVELAGEGQYRIPERARSATRQMIEAGYGALGQIKLLGAHDASRLLAFLTRLVEASRQAPEPPHKWALLRRFRVADEASPTIARIREAVMDLFGYRDDSHISAWRPWGVPGPAWNAFTLLWQGEATSPTQIAERAAFRGYVVDEYAHAIQTLLTRGWVEAASEPGAYRVTAQGKELRDGVERLTDAYFYAPWSCLNEHEIRELRDLLLRLRDHLLALP